MTQPQAKSSPAVRLVGGLIVIAGLLWIGLTAITFWGSSATGEPAEATSSSHEYAEPASSTLITGIVTDANGPVVGTAISVSVWPAEDDTEVGEAVDLLTLDPGRTDESGQYVVVLPLKDVPAKYLMRGRIVNFEVMPVEAGIGPISTSALHPQAATWWVDVFGDKNSDTKALHFDLDAMKATEVADGERQTWPLFEMPG